MKQRIKYIDGLKGVCGIWVCLFHYILAFFPAGYIGWGSGVADADKYAQYFAHFPSSILKNASFALYVFFALIAFIPALKFFQTHSEAPIRKQAVKRYFRLMPPALACSLFAYAVYSFGGMFHLELAQDVSCNWNRMFYPEGLTLGGAFLNGIFTAFAFGDSGYCSVLWCMNVIFIGSYLSYATLLLFGKLKGRRALYPFLFGICFLFPNYAAFLAGIIAADIVANGSIDGNSKWGIPFVLAGLAVGHFPPVLLGSVNFVYMFFAAGSLLLIVGCAKSASVQKILSANWLSFTGRISFAMVLTHFTILMSLSAWLFHSLFTAGWGFWTSLGVSWTASAPVVFLISWLFEKFVEQPSEKLATRIYLALE